MRYEILQDGNQTVLKVSDQMVAADRTEFGGAITKTVAGGRTVVVDMKGLEYMDSAGLGMLLTLREQATQKGLAVNIRNPEGDVREMLELACFDTLFSISHD